MNIELYGDIVSDDYDWLYSLFGIPHCCPKNIRDAMKELPEDEDLILEVNSPGGDVWAGFEIYGLLQKLQGRTEAHIIALAASAATTITSACSRVLASPVAQFMVHQPAAIAGYVNNEGARQLQNFLDSIKASIINGYVVKSGGKASRKTFEKLVDNETFMPIQDAIDLGLVDGFLDTDEEADALLSAGGGLKLSNSLGSQSADALLERYEAAVKAGTMQEVPGHPVSREAATDALEAASGADYGEGSDRTAYAVAVPGEDPVITENREVVESLIDQWRMQAAIDLERARDAI
ncbi:MAG: Clp protease ClpP [Oscillospiraceae bacterium]|nr:Clp protease ClpP [Oscillospiraceae bacterium]